VFSIGDLARRCGVSVPTVRYYEDRGLLAPAGRTSGNQRRYDSEGLRRLAFICHARDLGLSLVETGDLLALEGADCTPAHDIATRQLSRVRTRIAALQRLEAELSRIAALGDHPADSACRVIEALGDHRACDADHAPLSP
jgi:DNA-binding transcriptional MerR regulator